MKIRDRLSHWVICIFIILIINSVLHPYLHDYMPAFRVIFLFLWQLEIAGFSRSFILEYDAGLYVLSVPLTIDVSRTCLYHSSQCKPNWECSKVKPCFNPSCRFTIHSLNRDQSSCLVLINNKLSGEHLKRLFISSYLHSSQYFWQFQFRS